MGSALVENHLSRELGIGRTPVREAVRQLESEGLVTVLPRKGTFVSSINVWDFEALLDTRIMLEVHVARKLAGKIGPEQAEKLRSLFGEVSDLIEQSQIDKLLTIERNFHQGLVAILDNPYLNDMAERIYDLVTRTWYLSFKNRSKSDLASTLQDHLDILEKLEHGDAEEAEKDVRKHIMNFRNKVFHQPQKY